MKPRILLFEDELVIRQPLVTYLRAKGYEVLDFPSPVTCALVAEKKCACPREYACADLIITDMKMPGMTGLGLIRLMADKGCHVPPNNKIVISSVLTPEQQAEFHSLGCHYLPKPFDLDDLQQLVSHCATTISPHRQLVPVAELWKTACQQS